MRVAEHVAGAAEFQIGLRYFAIVVPMKEVTEEQRAQIEDIVTRKTGIGVENIVITPMSSAADTAAEESAQ